MSENHGEPVGENDEPLLTALHKAGFASIEQARRAMKIAMTPLEELFPKFETLADFGGRDKYVKAMFKKTQDGSPGISVENFDRSEKRIVFRDENGKPVAMADIVADDLSYPDTSPWHVINFATDDSRQLLAKRAAVRVGEKLLEMDVAFPSTTITKEAARVLQHAMKHRIRGISGEVRQWIQNLPKKEQ